MELLSVLRERVAAGRAFCPLSAATFLELLKQTMPESRRAIAEIVDELSLGVALCDEYERMTRELYYLLSKGAGEDRLPPIHSTVWVRLPYVLGVHYPSGTPFPKEDELVMQKAFTDHLWDRSLMDIVMMLDGSVPPDGSEASRGERVGYWFGRALRRFARRATSARDSMVEWGVHPFIATAVLWIVQLAVVVALIYMVFWLSLLIGLVITVARLLEHADLRGHCCSCPLCHSQCAWCNSPFCDDETWK